MAFATPSALRQIGLKGAYDTKMIERWTASSGAAIIKGALVKQTAAAGGAGNGYVSVATVATATDKFYGLALNAAAASGAVDVYPITPDTVLVAHCVGGAATDRTAQAAYADLGVVRELVISTDTGPPTTVGWFFVNAAGTSNPNVKVRTYEDPDLVVLGTTVNARVTFSILAAQLETVT